MENKGSVVILCAGGPAPGMNTVVASVAKRFISDNYKVYGLNYGYKTLFASETNYVEITYKLADQIYDKGGSFLKMSRYKPKNEEFNTRFFQEKNVKLLVTIGGDDTASSANRISTFLGENNVKIQNIHVPKTIDNDLPLPENLPTFGYQTAKQAGALIGKTVLEDARTSDGWFIVSAMGREAGHLAMGIGTACHYPMIIIPEMFNKVEADFDKIVKMIVSSMIKRTILGIEFGGAIVSEGVFHFIDEEKIKSSGINFTYDEHGHPELGKVSKAHIFNELVQSELKKTKLKIKSRPEEIGYEVRCVHPIAFDLKYCTMLGYGVKELFDRGESKCIVYVNKQDQIKALYMKDIAGSDGKVKPRLVDVSTEMFKVFFDSMEFVNELDYENARKYVDNPIDYDVKKILKW